MRYAWVLALALGCSHGAAPSTGAPAQGPVTATPRLPPLPQWNLDAPDAPYRAAVALQLQPLWAQFLEDCRLRLPATHPLNTLTLAATTELVIDAAGRVVEVALTSSGNADYDRAVRQVIADAAPLPHPPPALWTDDDRVHVRWLFARDRRQAGPATAGVIDFRLPVKDVVARLIAGGDLTRAARRLGTEPPGADRDAATTALMTAGLRESLGSSDAAVRRAAVEAIGRAHVGALAGEVGELVTSTSDVELRLAAIHATASLGDRASAHVLAEQLAHDIATDRRLAVAEAEALIALDSWTTVGHIVLPLILAQNGPTPIALHVHGLLPVAGLERVSEVTKALARAQQSSDPRVRAGVCAAIKHAPNGVAHASLARGLRDRDATVRAACIDAIRARLDAPHEATSKALVGAPNIERITELVKDRDVQVRAAAVRALAAAAADAPTTSFPDLATDSAAEVRSAYAMAIRALSQLRPFSGGQQRVRPLLEDRDPAVRAAAWQTLVVLLRKPIDRIEGDPPPPDFDQLLVRATKDPAPEVRVAVIAAVTDDAALTRLATSDDDGDVRTRALVALTGKRGRTATMDLLLERFVGAARGSAERVRTALAWHLAR